MDFKCISDLIFFVSLLIVGVYVLVSDASMILMREYWQSIRFTAISPATLRYWVKGFGFLMILSSIMMMLKLLPPQTIGPPDKFKTCLAMCMGKKPVSKARIAYCILKCIPVSLEQF